MTSAKISTFVLLIFLNYGKGSKYSEELNRPVSELNDPFRMMKVNLLWHKAKQVQHQRVYTSKSDGGPPWLSRLAGYRSVMTKESLTFAAVAVN